MTDHATPAVSGTVRGEVLCRASLWNWLQDWLDAMASDGDRHDMVMGGGGRCYDDCPACTAAKLAKAMREEAQNTTAHQRREAAYGDAAGSVSGSERMA